MNRKKWIYKTMTNLLKTHPFFSDKTIASCERLEHQGYCNENYLLIADGVKYIVRKLLREDIDRELECYSHHLAYQKGLTAKLHYYDRGEQYMVFEFIEGHHKLALDEAELKRLVLLIKTLHSIEISPTQYPLMSPKTLLSTPYSQAISEALDTINSYSPKYALCHNDLNPQNLLWDKESLKCIDFEYAGRMDVYFDLACMSIEFKLTEQEDKKVLEDYFGDESYFIEKLEAYKVMYRALCEAWFLNMI
ncbi:MAG: choline/ethanolamine kinase family protein [Sulfurovum sp.]|nr:choline/ethanolamine kinase family protein [Sulfurovum sp.]